MGQRWVPLIAITMAIALASPTRANAQQRAALPDDAKTKALAAVREGNRLLDAGKAEAALAKFREAHELVGGDKLFYNIGQASTAIPGQEVEAYLAFQTFLDRATTASAETLASARAQKAELSRRIAFLTIDTKPSAAEVMIDRRPRGASPIEHPIPLLPGRHVIQVDRQGHERAKETITLHASETLRHEVNLVPITSVAKTEHKTPAIAPVNLLPEFQRREPATAGLAESPADPSSIGLAANDSAVPRPRPVYAKPLIWGVLAALVAAGAVTAIIISSSGSEQARPIAVDQTEEF